MPESQDAELQVSFDGHVAVLELRRPPHNFLDHAYVARIADALDGLAADPRCRAVVLCSQGKSFSAGAQLAGPHGGVQPIVAGSSLRPHLYKEALRLFAFPKPVIAAVQGAAVGAGLGLALVADFRVAAPEARFVANFTRLGFHPGFGITATLPRLVGGQAAALMMYTGRRIKGDEALAMGLADELADLDDLRPAALRLAAEIAEAAPLAVGSVRQTLRRGLLDEIETATERELMEQTWLRATADFDEGRAAVAERRPADFKGR